MTGVAWRRDKNFRAYTPFQTAFTSTESVVRRDLIKRLKFECGMWNAMLLMRCHALSARWMFARLVGLFHISYSECLQNDEECRWVPRVRDMPNHQSESGAHVNTSAIISNIICYCEKCNESVERGLPIRISEFCDCDQYKRWICLPCSRKESQRWIKYCKSGKIQGGFEYNQAPLPRNEEGIWLPNMPDDMTVRTIIYWKISF